MLSNEDIRRLCDIPDKNKAYFRPFLCKGGFSKVDIFLVGINPATPIFQSDLELDEYVALIQNNDKFYDYYKKLRISKGKSELSRTRVGIDSFIKWLSDKTNLGIIETNVITYPTESLKLLWNEPDFVIDKGKQIFLELLINISPKIMILHGKEALNQFVDLSLKKQFIVESLGKLNRSIDELEQVGPLLNIRYPDGKTGTVLACRHFMYYGKNGDSYSNFKNQLVKICSHA